jgi:hypothetical protein
MDADIKDDGDTKNMSIAQNPIFFRIQYGKNQCLWRHFGVRACQENLCVKGQKNEAFILRIMSTAYIHCLCQFIRETLEP